MQFEIALLNLQTLKNLKDDVKLTAKSNGTLKIDDRWMNGIRRTAGGDSKKDILEPIEQTFIAIVNHPSYDRQRSEELIDVLYHLKVTFAKTYPKFDDLQSKLQDLLKNNEWNIKMMNTGSILSNRLSLRDFSSSHNVKENDAASLIDNLIKLHKLELTQEDTQKIKTLYCKIYRWYYSTNEVVLPKISRCIVYNVLVHVLMLDVDTFMLSKEYTPQVRNFEKIVQDYILSK